VLATLYLPLWISRPEGGVVSISDAPRSRRERRSPFRNVNTDAMALASEETPEMAEAPGRAALAAHVEAFIGGFADLYRFLVHHRDALTAADGPLAAFRGLPVRVLLGSTRGYVLIQRRAAACAHLGDGADWSIQLDFVLASIFPPKRRPTDGDCSPLRNPQKSSSSSMGEPLTRSASKSRRSSSQSPTR
jgi:Domain of unknown function (DUF4135)